MKNLFKYFALVAVLFGTNMALVNAEAANVTEAGDTDITVRVNNVEIPVYDVTINWQNFTYNWEYDNQSLSYKWMNSEIFCNEIYDYTDYEEKGDVGTLYTDDQCSNSQYFTNDKEIEEYLVDNTLYYFYRDRSHIMIEDESTGGYITPSFSWNPVDKYNFTTGKFAYNKAVLVCGEVNPEDYAEVTWAYTNSDCTGEKISTAGDKIGTVTISIEAH